MSTSAGGNTQSFPPVDDADSEIALTARLLSLSPPSEIFFAEDRDSVPQLTTQEEARDSVTAHRYRSLQEKTTDENVNYDEIMELTIRGINLRQQFEDLGNLADIAEAISVQRLAIQHLPTGHAHMPRHLISLAISLNSRFHRTGNLSDLSEVISAKQRVVELTANGDQDMPHRLATLGNSLWTRFQHTGDVTDISEAILTQQKALQLTPNGHREMPFWLSNLGVSFQSRFERTGDMSDIVQAISIQQQATLLARSDSFDMPYMLNSLADTLYSSFQHTGNPEDISIATSIYRRSAKTSGPPLPRLDAAQKWAKLTTTHDSPQSIEAYGVAIDLISQVAGMDSTVEERHRHLIDISSLTTAAAAAAFTLGESQKALEWLEQGRCLVWNQLNQLRTPAEHLRAHDEHLGQRFLRISSALESSSSRRYQMYPSRDAPDSQKLAAIEVNSEYSTQLKLSREWTQLLEEIRQIPVFSEFLRPPQASNLLQNLPPDGPIIIINVHESRCDALALISGRDAPIHILLDDFTHKQASELRDRLRGILLSHRIRGREVDRGPRPVLDDIAETQSESHLVLEILWQRVVKPIVDCLFNCPPSHPGRIWWCPTGPLAFLPLHAAGIYSRNEQPQPGSCICDFAVSSYTPTVSALLEKFRNAVDTHRPASAKLLIISQPNTPGCKSIPGTTREMNTVASTIGTDDGRSLSSCLEAELATVSQVKLEMASHGSIHFACHASQDVDNPLRSGFYLHDGRLELADIMQQRIPYCDLAYLSACQTSTGDEKLSEEAVHIAAGMLAVGYRSVVATMWSIKDSTGPVVAERFYKYLMDQGSSARQLELDGTRAAHALHYAIQGIRKPSGDTEQDLLTHQWL